MCCLATVKVSVSGRNADGGGSILPMSGTRLLTIEWE